MQEALVKIAKKLKKNNVAVDVVSFGSEEVNTEKLEAFHAAVNSNGNSHLVTVPPGTILSDMLFGTPIFMEEGAGGGGGVEEGGAPAAPRCERHGGGVGGGAGCAGAAAISAPAAALGCWPPLLVLWHPAIVRWLLLRLLGPNQSLHAPAVACLPSCPAVALLPSLGPERS